MYCRHATYIKECARCQMAAFLCVNEYGGRLPHIDIDACRVILRHLEDLNRRDRLAREVARQSAIRVTVNSLCGFMLGPSYDMRRLFPPVVPGAAYERNPLDVLRAAEDLARSKQKQERKARQKQFDQRRRR